MDGNSATQKETIVPDKPIRVSDTEEKEDGMVMAANNKFG